MKIPVEVLFKKIKKTETCWLWTGSIGKRGYGTVFFKGKNYYAHRSVFQTLRGSVPKKLTLDHLCRVRHCVNPSHLEIITRGENVLRGISIPAKNAVKTHCLNGHPLFGPNLYERRDGYRNCKKCQYDRNLRTRARRT